MTAWSRGAKELIRPELKTEPAHPAGIPAKTYLPELFRAQDQPHIETWLRAGLHPEADGHGAKYQPFRAKLLTGVEVRLSLAVPAQGQATVVSLEPLAARESTGQAGNAEIELQNVIEWLEEGVVLSDAQDNIRAMNTRFEQIAGLTPQESAKIKTLEELIGRLKNKAAEPERFEEQWRELSRGIEGGVREELQMTHPAPRILERAARPVLDPVGRLLGRVEVYRDLTAQRAFHSKLLQTEKLAALGQLVSGIAHELSNPLTSILGYAQRILARQDLPGRTEEVRQIYQEAERANSILRQLLLNARETLPERRGHGPGTGHRGERGARTWRKSERVEPASRRRGFPNRIASGRGNSAGRHARFTIPRLEEIAPRSRGNRSPREKLCARTRTRKWRARARCRRRADRGPPDRRRARGRRYARGNPDGRTRSSGPRFAADF